MDARSNERVPPSFAPHVMSPAAVDSKPRAPVGAGFERAKERIARRRRGKGDRDGSSVDGDVCAPVVEDAVPNVPTTSSHAKGESSDDGESSGATMRRWCCNVCTWTEAPAWAVHNRYIHTGYRTGGGYVGALRSVRPRPVVIPNPPSTRRIIPFSPASTSTVDR